MKLHRFLLTALLALSFAGPSQAAILFSNLGQTDNGAAGFNDLDDLLASDFLTDAQARTITNLSARLDNSSSLQTLTVTFSIFADNGNGKPGTLVSAFDTPASVPPNTSSGSFNATDAGIDLLANTKYWVVGQLNAPEGLGTVTWRFNLGEGTDGGPFATVPGTEMQYAPNGGLYINNDVGNQLFSLEGFTTVPEPTGLALLITAGIFGTSGAFRWWRRRRVTLSSLPDREPAS